LVVFFNEFKKVIKLIHESGLITYINWLIKSLLVPSKALLRLAGDLADSGFRGIIRAYYVRRGFGALSIEFIIYRRPSSSRRLLARIRRALERRGAPFPWGAPFRPGETQVPPRTPRRDNKPSFALAPYNAFVPITP